MSEFTDEIKTLLERRDFAEVRTKIDEVLVDGWKEKMLNNEISSMLKDAAKDFDIEKVSALLHNPYKYMDRNQFTYQQSLQAKSFEEDFNELIVKSVPLNILDLQKKRELGERLPAVAGVFQEALEWDKMIYSITDNEIFKMIDSAEELLDSDEKDEEYKKLASILIGRLKRDLDINLGIYEEVFPEVCYILSRNPYNKEPDNLWIDVFLENVRYLESLGYNRNREIMEMFNSLNENAKCNPIFVRIFAELLDEIYGGNTFDDDHQVERFESLNVIHRISRDLNGLIYSKFPREVLLHNSIAFDPPEVVQQVINDAKDLLLSKECINALMVRVCYIVNEGADKGAKDAEVFRVILDSLTPEEQELLIFGNEELARISKTQIFGSIIRGNNLKLAELLLDRQLTSDQKIELLSGFTDFDASEYLTDEMRQILGNEVVEQFLQFFDITLENNSELEEQNSESSSELGDILDILQGSDNEPDHEELNIPQGSREEEEIREPSPFSQAFEEMLEDLAGLEDEEIPLTSPKHPRSPTVEEHQTKRQRGDER